MKTGSQVQAAQRGQPGSNATDNASMLYVGSVLSSVNGVQEQCSGSEARDILVEFSWNLEPCGFMAQVVAWSLGSNCVREGYLYSLCFPSSLSS